MIGREEVRRAVSKYVETPVASVMNRMGLTPNAVTMIGLLIAGGAAYLAGVGLWWAAGVVALFAGVFDMFDGALARATGRDSDFGALLDSTIDRVSEAVILLGVLAHYLAKDNDAGAMLVFGALVGSIMVSYMRARSEGLGIECKVGVMTRPERVALTGLGLIVAHWIPAVMLAVLGIITTLTVLTAIHRLTHTWRMLGSEK